MLVLMMGVTSLRICRGVALLEAGLSFHTSWGSTRCTRRGQQPLVLVGSCLLDVSE